MRVCVLASGSSGNSTFIEINNTRMLIDVGTNITNIESKLKNIGTSLSQINYIFISHTHSDHTSSLEKIINKYRPIVCLSEKMHKEIPYIKNYTNIIKYDSSILIEDITIDFIKTSHDTSDSRGFIITHDNKSVVYITDTGYLNTKFITQLKNKELYIFESNHDPELLINGKYPKWLQARILSDVGHLSNNAASMYLAMLIGPKTRKIILAHLSKENNTAEIALKVLNQTLMDYDICFNNVIVAKQEQETEVVELWLILFVREK